VWTAPHWQGFFEPSATLEDPIDEGKASLAQRKAKATVTFAEAARAYHKHHSGRWSNAANAKQIMTRLERFAFPVLGPLAVDAIDRGAVLRAFSPFWVAGQVHAASRTLTTVADVMEFAKSRGWRSGDNPARNFAHDLPAPRSLTPTKPMEAMPYAQLPAFYASLGPTVTERCIAFVVLTATRSGEAREARWTEIDLEKALWTIPAARMKKRKEHVIPLSGAVMDIIRHLPREKGNPHLFVGARHGAAISRMAMIQLMRARGEVATIHGFRSSFRVWAGEMTSFPPDIIEMALAHAVGSGVERSYARTTLLEKRRQLMQMWADHVMGAAGAKVISLRA
jgi:integrase